ncbi:MAG: ABC transporter substrate-binding protein [Acidobacteria bacterium]|nr:ABC transporter substrate-binding protein [Acidobacteriota bacterium]
MTLRLCVPLAALLFSGCARPLVDATFPEVRVAVGGQQQFVYLPATLAQRLGYYQAEGVRVTLEDFPGGSKALEALLGGSADVVCGFYDHTIQMAAEGRPLQAFVSLARSPGFALVVSPVAKNVRRVEDLKGATVGVTAPGSSSHLLLRFLLSKHGLAPDAASATAIGSAATAVAAVARGKVDAAMMFDPAITQLQKKHPNLAILADARTERGVREIFGVPVYPASAFYSTAAWMQRNPDLARRLARALRRTLEWIQTHTPRQIMEQMPPEYRGEDPAIYLEALERSMHIFSPDGLMPPEGPETVRRMLAQSLEKAPGAGLDLAATYTNEFVRSK